MQTIILNVLLLLSSSVNLSIEVVKEPDLGVSVRFFFVFFFIPRKISVGFFLSKGRHLWWLFLSRSDDGNEETIYYYIYKQSFVS